MSAPANRQRFGGKTPARGVRRSQTPEETSSSSSPTPISTGQFTRRLRHGGRARVAMEHAQTLPGETVFDGVTPAMLEEMLNSLAIETWQPSQPREPCEGAFGRERVAENIFLICEKLQLHNSVKYLAVELFDRYMLQQTKAQCDEWLKEKAAGSSDEINWEARLPDLKSELLLLLRMVSCVQIASKQMAHYKMVTLKPAQMLIQALSGSSIDLEQILSSEVAVLKALNYYINPASPLTHVDMIIAVLGYNDPTLPVKTLHSISLKVLDVVYLLRTAVYNDLLLATSTRDALDPSDVTYRENFWRVEGDFMLLAVSVISAAAYFCCYPICQKVMEQACRTTCIPEQDVSNFAKVLVQCVWKLEDRAQS